MDKTTETVFIIFTALSAISVLIQACAIIGIFIAARRTQKKLHTVLEEVRVHALPALATSRNLLEDIAPKLKVVSANLLETSAILRNKADEVGTVVSEVVNRTRTEASRIDGMVHGTLNQIAQATHAVQHGVSIPVRQLSGILNGLRAGLNALWQKEPAPVRESEYESAKEPLV